MTETLGLCLAGLVIVCGAIDFKTGLIPNSITYSAFPLLLAAAATAHVLPYALAGSAAVGGALLGLHLLTRGLGIGLGDVKLAACIGAALGPSRGLFALGSAFVLGAGVALGLLWARKAQRGDAIVFGPFLAAGSLAAVTLAPWIVEP